MTEIYTLYLKKHLENVFWIIFVPVCINQCVQFHNFLYWLKITEISNSMLKIELKLAFHSNFTLVMHNKYPSHLMFRIKKKLLESVTLEPVPISSYRTKGLIIITTLAMHFITKFYQWKRNYKPSWEFQHPLI